MQGCKAIRPETKCSAIEIIRQFKCEQMKLKEQKIPDLPKVEMPEIPGKKKKKNYDDPLDEEIDRLRDMLHELQHPPEGRPYKLTFDENGIPCPEYISCMDNMNEKLRAEEKVVDDLEEQVRFTNKENIRDKLKMDNEIIHGLRKEKEEIIEMTAEAKQHETKLLLDIEVLENKCTELMV